jgi:hypothetical protein
MPLVSWEKWSSGKRLTIRGINSGIT